MRSMVALLSVVCPWLSGLPATAQSVPSPQEPTFLRSVELKVPESLCSAAACGLYATSGIAYDGAYYYLAFTRHNDRARGAVHLYDLSGNFVKAIGDGGPDGGRLAVGVAVDGPHVWTSDSNAIYQYDIATGRLIDRFDPMLPEGFTRIRRLGHDGESLWVVNTTGLTFHRVDPAAHAVTGKFHIDWPDRCRAFDIAPDGVGGVWVSAPATCYRYPRASRPTRWTQRFALTPTATSRFEATLVSKYTCVAPGRTSYRCGREWTGSGFVSQTTNASQRAEMLLEQEHRNRDGQVVIPVKHFAMPAYGLMLERTRMMGCKSTTGYLTLMAPAPSGGLSVPLHADSPLVTVPPEVVVAEGTVTASFPVATAPVTGFATARVEAEFPGLLVDASVRLEEMRLRSLNLWPNPVVGGRPVVGRATLACPAGPGEIVVGLTARDPWLARPTTNPLRFPVGTQSVTFAVETTPVTGRQWTWIRADLNCGRRSSVPCRTAELVVTPGP